MSICNERELFGELKYSYSMASNGDGVKVDLSARLGGSRDGRRTAQSSERTIIVNLLHYSVNTCGLHILTRYGSAQLF